MMATHTGSVCPEGHGKIGSKLPLAVQRRNHALLLGLEEVQMTHGGKYTIPSRPGEKFAKERVITRVLSRVPRDEHVYALDGDKILQMSKVL